MDLTPISTTTHAIHTANPTRPANGSLKRLPPATAPPPPTMVVSSAYKECLKNHAASIGGHALDGCGEFMPSPTSNPADPRSLKCAACGCHRNFHRRDALQEYPNSTPNFLNCFYSPPPAAMPPPAALAHRGLSTSTSPSQSPSPSPSPSPMSSPSPPPLSHFPPSSYHSSGGGVPHMLLGLGTGCSGPSDELHRSFNSTAAMVTKAEKETPSGKKRCRTKFSQEQKERMYAFSEKLGWKMQKGDDESIQEFCDEIGVSRGVFKVWMHNNKNTFRIKRSEIGNNTTGTEKVVNGDDKNGHGGGFDSDINKNPIVNTDIHISTNQGGSVDLHASSVNGSSS